MSQKQATQRRWIVHRTFELDRLSPATLIQAYAQLVPAHMRVLRLPPTPSEGENCPATKVVSLSDQASIKPSEWMDGPALWQDSLVIEAITKQEVN